MEDGDDERRERRDAGLDYASLSPPRSDTMELRIGDMHGG